MSSPRPAERAARSEGESTTAQAQLPPAHSPRRITEVRRAAGERGLPKDRLRSIKRANEPYDLVRNYYDAQGQKTISLHPGATSTEEVYHAGALTLRADGNGYATTKHIYAGGQRLASKMDHRWFTEDPVQYYATDHLGSTNFTFDSVGNVISHTEYFPSGEIWRSETLASHSGINQYQFTGKEWDDVTGLYDFGYRSYDPVVGQWLSPDPIMAGYVDGAPKFGVYWSPNLNAYGYAANNPVKYVDQQGEFPWIAVGIGVSLDVGTQLVLMSMDPDRKFNAWSVVVSAGASATGVGLLNVIQRSQRLVAAGRAAQLAAEVGADAAISAGSTLLKGDNVTAEGLAADVLLGQAAGRAAGQAAKNAAASSPEGKQLGEVADRATRIADPTRRGATRRPGRQAAKEAKAADARGAYDNYVDAAESAAGAAASGAAQSAYEIVTQPADSKKEAARRQFYHYYGPDRE